MTTATTLLAGIRLQLAMIYGNQPGTAVLCTGRNPRLDAGGKYGYPPNGWLERPYAYEVELDMLADAAAKDMDTHDVFICGCLMRNGRRAKGKASSRMALHADLDGGYDEAKVRAVGGCAVGSGTPDHAHVYVPLTASVDAATYERLCRLLRRYLGAADAKVVDNDVLRLIGTNNHKPRVCKNESPAPVEWLLEYDGTRVDPGVLEAQLTQLAGGAAPPPQSGFSSNGQAPSAHLPFDLGDYPAVAAAIAHDSGDRSADTARIVAACVDARLTLAECRWAVQQHPGAAARLAARHDDDVLTCWIKTIDDRHRRVRVTGQPGGDPAPVPLSQRVVPPPFPVDALPRVAADMVWAVSRATETDPAMVGSQALAALSVCTTGRAKFKIRAGWTEPLNLYLACIADVGERKSSVQGQLFEPLYAHEQKLIEETAPKIAKAAEQRELAKRELDKARKAALGDPAKQQAALDAAVKLAGIVVPARPQLFAGNITAEAAEIRLAEQGGRLSVISVEGGVFDVMAGRYNAGDPNFDVWLQAHSGDRLDVDRVSRDSVHLPYAYMTVGLMMQPAVLAKIAAHQQFRGRGLLARFLYAWPESRVGSRDVGTTVAASVSDAYRTAVTELAEHMRKDGKPVLLTPSAAAEQRIIELHRAFEPTLADGEELDLIRDWGSKYVGTVARIAGILHLAEVPGTTVVAAAEVERAILLGEYFTASTLNALGEMGADPIVADAEYLLRRIATLGLRTMSERDLHQQCRSRFPTRDVLSPVIDRLVDNGYLIPLDTAAKVRQRGRPPSTGYRLANFQGKP